MAHAIFLAQVCTSAGPAPIDRQQDSDFASDTLTWTWVSSGPTGVRHGLWSTGFMRIERIVPDLTVTDLPKAVRQHAEILGLTAVMDHGWIVTLADEAGHQMSLITTDATAPVNPDVSIFVDDVDAAYDAARASSVEIVHPLSEEAWGVRRFFYRDAAGRVANVGSHADGR